ncbi:hypothetical protein [Armatimonas sp.]|uniref:hypothetical protein n=1 Tax=Armatimonas sp. TaxID=1872638 RepID=UPI003752014C
MPTISSATLQATLAAIQRHWAAAETALGRAIVLKSGTGLAQLTALHQTVSAIALAQVTPENQRQAAALTRDTTRTAVRAVNSRLVTSVRGLLPETEFVAQLPALPTSNALAEKQLRAARDLESIWTSINALPENRYPSVKPPLTILVKEDGATNALTLANYSARIAAYETAQSTIRQLDETLATLNLRRDDAIKKARKALTEYRAAIRALFPEDSEQVQTLPKL